MFRYDTPTAHLRSLAILEGLSYLVLLFVAMPLKYMADQPLPVRLVGSLHGLLFTWLMLLLLQGMRVHGKSFAWAFRIGIASLIPFGMMFIDGSLKREDEEYRRKQSSE